MKVNVFYLYLMCWSITAPGNGQQCQSGNIRLMGGSSIREGRVQICIDGEWTAVSYDEWDASYVCRQLGFSDTGASSERSERKAGNSAAVTVTCAGQEQMLSQCSFTSNRHPNTDVTCQNCSNSKQSEQCTGVGTGLGVLVAVLVVLLVLTTGGCIYLLLQNKEKDRKITNTKTRDNVYTSDTTQPQGSIHNNPTNNSHELPTPPQESEQTESAQYSSLGPAYAVLEPPGTMVKQEGGSGGGMAATYEVPMNLQQESADYFVLEPEGVQEDYSCIQQGGADDDYSHLQH